jgi:hypothetical protein
MVDCQWNTLPLTSGGNFINPLEGDCEPVPAESSTWGRIKSLFSDQAGAW